MTRKTVSVLLALCMLALCLAGCAGKTNEPAEGPRVLQEGDAAPDFTANLAGGGTFRLSDYSDGVVLLNFWATWCPPCVRELPAFEQLAGEAAEGFALLAVNCSEPGATVDAFLAENGYTFPVAYDEDGGIGAWYPTDGIPYTLIISGGIIQKIYLGAPADAYAEYKGAVEACLENGR